MPLPPQSSRAKDPSHQAVAQHDFDDKLLLTTIIETQNDLAAVELDPQIIMRLVAERTQKLTGADGAAVELTDGDSLLCHACTGIMKPFTGRRLPLAGSLAGYATISGEFIYSSDTDNDPRADQASCRELGLRSLVAVPLLNAGKSIGVIVAISRNPGAFPERLIAALRLVAGLVTASLIHASELEIKKNLLADRTRTLLALRESEQKFQSAFAHAGIGMALVGLDGRWMQVNDALCRIIGYTEQELLVTDFQSVTYPADLNGDLALVQQLIAGTIADYHLVKRYIHRRGHLVWVMLTVSLVRDDEGKPLHFISQIQDITQRQHAEDALRLSEEEYRATFELAGVGKVQTDLASTRFLRVNRKFCEIVGYSSDELQCLSFAQITHPDDVESSRDMANRMLKGEINDHSTEKRYVRKDGKIIWVSINATVLKDSTGRNARGVATILDITERKQAEWLEKDRRRVLEMIATDMPLPEVFDGLTKSVERQIDGSTVAVMVLEDGNIFIHAAGMPETWRAQLRVDRFLLASRLSEGVSRDDGSCGVSHLRTDLAWEGFSRAHPEAAHMTCWTVVVKAADGNAVGLLLVLRPETRRPDPTELQTLSMASKLATICIEHHQMTCQLSHLVRHDRLTGLPNRLMLEDRMQHALAIARRSGNKVGVMVLDIDKFKNINDTMGHQAGDHLLQHFARRLSGVLRETDTMARIGGDEFVIVLPELPGKEPAAIVARKLIDSLAEPFAYGDRCIRATTSIGIALFPDDGDDAATIQKRADEALYRVKEQGRNGFSF